jgi:hypothetical protein
MSVFDPTPDPGQRFRSPLGTSPGTPGPLGAPLPPDGLPPDIGAGPPPTATELPAIPAAGGDSEVDLLKAMIVSAHDYLDLPTVEEHERLQMEKVTTILQQLLAANQKMSDQATGASAQTRKLLGGIR